MSKFWVKIEQEILVILSRKSDELCAKMRRTVDASSSFVLLRQVIGSFYELAEMCSTYTGFCHVATILCNLLNRLNAESEALQLKVNA